MVAKREKLYCAKRKIKHALLSEQRTDKTYCMVTEMAACFALNERIWSIRGISILQLKRFLWFKVAVF